MTDWEMSPNRGSGLKDERPATSQRRRGRTDTNKARLVSLRSCDVTEGLHQQDKTYTAMQDLP